MRGRGGTTAPSICCEFDKKIKLSNLLKKTPILFTSNLLSLSLVSTSTCQDTSRSQVVRGAAAIPGAQLTAGPQGLSTAESAGADGGFLGEVLAPLLCCGQQQRGMSATVLGDLSLHLWQHGTWETDFGLALEKSRGAKLP